MSAAEKRKIEEEREGAPVFEHCESKRCLDTRAGLACSCRPCALCDAQNGAILRAAATLEHCGSAICLKRLINSKAEPYEVPFPGCACGCEACDLINVTAGIRPPFLRTDFRSEASKPFYERQDAIAKLAPEEPEPTFEPLEDLDFLPLEDLDGPPVNETRAVLEAPVALGELVTQSMRELADLLDPDAVLKQAPNVAAELEEKWAEDRRRLPLADPPWTGSKSELARQCLYWLQGEAERIEDESSMSAIFGTTGHTFAEEYQRGTMTAKRESELLERVPTGKLRDSLAIRFAWVRKWVDSHKGAFNEIEMPVAWDPDVGDLGRGVGLHGELDKFDGHRRYAHPFVWAALREQLELGPHTIPATIDLLRFEEGELVVYDWCFGRTDKRRQLALGALAAAGIYSVESARGVALYVDDDGVHEVPYPFDSAALLGQAQEFRELLGAAPGASPLVGLHCVQDHCPARVMCPATQGAAAMVLDPSTPAEMVVFKETGGVPITRAFRFSPTIEGREHAAWLLPRLKLLEDAAEAVDKALRTWTSKQLEPWVATSPGKCWREITVKGTSKFDQKHALALLETLGATEEQIGGCWRVGPPTKKFQETNIPKKEGGR